MNSATEELLYPAGAGIVARIADNMSKQYVTQLGAHSNRKLADLLVGYLGTYGNHHVPQASKAGMRQAAAGAIFDLAGLFYEQYGAKKSSTSTGAQVLDYQVLPGNQPGQPQVQPGGSGLSPALGALAGV